MTSLYDLAITSYALAKSGSSLGAVAFSKLDKFAILKGKYIWQMSRNANWATPREKMLQEYADSEGPDQTAHLLDEALLTST